VQPDADAVTAGDLEAMLALYQSEATFVMPSGMREGSVTGLADLRQTFSNFLAIGPKLTIDSERTVRAGDTALVIGNWRLTGRRACRK